MTTNIFDTVKEAAIRNNFKFRFFKRNKNFGRLLVDVTHIGLIICSDNIADVIKDYPLEHYNIYRNDEIFDCSRFVAESFFICVPKNSTIDNVLSKKRDEKLEVIQMYKQYCIRVDITEQTVDDVLALISAYKKPVDIGDNPSVITLSDKSYIGRLNDITKSLPARAINFTYSADARNEVSLIFKNADLSKLDVLDVLKDSGDLFKHRVRNDSQYKWLTLYINLPSSVWTNEELDTLNYVISIMKLSTSSAEIEKINVNLDSDHKEETINNIKTLLASVL